MTPLVVKAQIAYLDLLKDHGLLEQAMLGKLPDHVHKAALKVAVSKVPGAKYNPDSGQLEVTADEQELIDKEIREYLKHYKLVVERPILLGSQMPREILKGKKYEIKSGTFAGFPALVKGTDKEVFGCEWAENFGHPVCEAFVFRCQRDQLFMDGRFFVVQLDGRKDVLVHESELGPIVN